MAETNINAYKVELTEARIALANAQARVDGLEAHIVANEPIEPEVLPVAPKPKKAK